MLYKFFWYLPPGQDLTASAAANSGTCTSNQGIWSAGNATALPPPFVVKSNIVITATSATVKTQITFNPADLGKPGAVFVTGWVQLKSLSLLGIASAGASQTVTRTRNNPYTAAAADLQVSRGILAETDTNAFVLVQLTATGWQLVINGQLVPFATGVMGEALASQSILDNADPTRLLGAQLCLGYGASPAEMIASGRMLPVVAISGATDSGSCNIAATGTNQVTEFYNKNLDNYFITADPNEVAAIDQGGAGPGWSRTGYSFKSGGSTPVCRFYGSQSPGPNSHFYTVDPNECASLKQQQASTPITQKRWNFESLDFVSTSASNGNCASGTVPVYRAYNNGFSRGIDSNHRITSNKTMLQEALTRGWSNEGVVMCAPN